MMWVISIIMKFLKMVVPMSQNICRSRVITKLAKFCEITKWMIISIVFMKMLLLVQCQFRAYRGKRILSRTRSLLAVGARWCGSPPVPPSRVLRCWWLVIPQEDMAEERVTPNQTITPMADLTAVTVPG